MRLRAYFPAVAVALLLGVPLGLASFPSRVVGLFPPVERATLAVAFVAALPVAFALIVVWLSYLERRGPEDDASAAPRDD